jgi:hypothetical protein
MAQRRRHRVLTVVSNLCSLLVLSASGAAVAQDEMQIVTGAVVNAAGEPAAGVRVASSWLAGKGMSPRGSLQSDAAGKFELSVVRSERPLAFLAIDMNEQLGGLAVFDEKTIGQPVVIRLGPLIAVRGKFTCTDLGHPLSYMDNYVTASSVGIRILQTGGQNGRFAFKLPEGKYTLVGDGPDVMDTAIELNLAVEKPDVDLGEINLKGAPIALHKGKAPPSWHVTDARCAPKTVQLSDYRGKWVLLEFWGFW